MLSRAFIDGFSGEMDKMGFDVGGLARTGLGYMRAGGLPLLAGAALASLALYDRIRGTSKEKELTPAVIRGELEGEQVTSRAHIQDLLKKAPMDRPIVPVTTEKGVGTMMQDAQMPAIAKPAIEAFAKRVVQEGTNAAVFRGDSRDYIIIPKKVNPRVIEHEIGHLKDFARKDYQEPSLIQRILGKFWKPTYKATTMAEEERAWKHARKTPMREQALKSYERAFHERRGKILAGAAAVPTGWALGAMVQKALEGANAGGIS